MSSRRKSPRTPILQRLRQAFAAFFQHDIGLQRGKDGVRVVLQAAPPKPALPTTREQEAARREQDELALMLTQLAELLDEMPDTRRTLRHLVGVERALRKHGLRALHKLPLAGLEKALAQFEALVTNWSPVGLASLRSKMAVAILDREHHDPEKEADAYRTAAVLDTVAPGTAVEVTECSEEEALAAAYAALGQLAPPAVEVQGELQSASARALDRATTRPAALAAPDSLELRSLPS